MFAKYSKLSFALLAWNFGFASFVSADDASFLLAYKFQAGQFSHYDADDRAEMIMQNASVLDKEDKPLQSKSVQQTQMQKSFRVIAVDEKGVAVLEPIVEKVRMASQTGDRGIINYDSTKDETPPKEFENIAGTLGRPLARFQFAPNGRLLKVSLLVNDVPKNFSAAAEKADPVINFLVVFPEKPVKVGEKWNEKFDSPVSIGNGLTEQITLIKSFELAKVVDNVATIKCRTSLFTPTTDPRILGQLAQMTSSGTIEFDINQGRVLSKYLQFDEKVVNAFGAQTLLHARGESLEKLLPPNGAVRVSSGAPNPLPK